MFDDFGLKGFRIIEEFYGKIDLEAEKKQELIDNALNRVNIKALAKLLEKLPSDKKKNIEDRLKAKEVTLELANEIKSNFTNSELGSVYFETLREYFKEVIDLIRGVITPEKEAELNDFLKKTVFQ